MIRKHYYLLIVCIGLCFSSCTAPSYENFAEEHSLPQKVDFNFHIKPILSDRCFACHGPDNESREAGLRLDTESGAFAALQGNSDHFAIKPGNLSQSVVWERIISNDPAIQMPPPESKLSLTPKEIALIGKWIDQGAEWKEHWAFIVPTSPDPDELKSTVGKEHIIDFFVKRRLKEEKMEPSPKASKEQLLRRLSFGLTGLPPSPEEIADFIADDDPNAYENKIDELLSRSTYGERMAVDWLDLARYADTHGYQADRFRRMWPWRDWVIKAFNDNMSYDQFVTWQLAGDLLPKPSREQVLATAFNRNHMQTEEGGSVEEEFRTEYVADRAITTSRAFLGITMECARCHDHKYDPVSQKEFYQFFSFFNNVDESGQTSHFTDAVPVPALLLTEQDTDQKLAHIQNQIDSLEVQLDAADNEFEKWLGKNSQPHFNLRRGLVGDFTFDNIQQSSVQNKANRTLPGKLVEDPISLPGKSKLGLKLSGENGLTFKGLGVFSRSDPFSLSIWVKVEEELERAVLVHRTQAVLDAGSRGYELMIDSGKVSIALTHMWPHNEIRKISTEKLPSGEWVHLTMTYDGSSQASGAKLFINGEEAATHLIKDNLTKDILYERIDVNLTIGYRFRGKGFKNGLIDNFKVYNRSLSGLEISALYQNKTPDKVWDSTNNISSPKKRSKLKEYYLKNHSKSYDKVISQLHALRDEQRQLVDTIPEIMVMNDLPEKRQAYILMRGAYDQPGEPVNAGTPESILPFSSNYAPNRLGLAAWLFDEENPLTARVIVNRIWQMHFGKGLVSTPEDFGNQGALPTHPALLDYLANHFRASGWDIKALHKLILLSETYQQSSYATPSALEKDPENLFLARGPAFRLSAEMPRDQALLASGLLVSKQGGPSVFPYQPPGLWKEKSGKVYVPDTGEGLYRRSLYTFWKRTSPPPNMMTLDAVERNICIVKRQSTSTPLQALVLLNDVQFVEAARKLGEQMIRSSDKLEAQIQFGFLSLTGREAKAREIDILQEMFQEQLNEFSTSLSSAKALLSEGAASYDQDLDPVQLAATTVIANAMMNYDESIMLR